jgi:oligopeptide/dipeptide ABC transporter ATP-binding protein
METAVMDSRPITAPILEVQELRVAYYSRGAAPLESLAGVTFELGRGEILGVLGESGSGKSTLAASLLRLLPPNGIIAGGRVVLEGGDVLQISSKALQQLRGARISLLAQEPSLALHPMMRIDDQVEEVLRAHEVVETNARRKRVHELLATLFPGEGERVGSSYPHQLSGGQRQRALIAQAIICRPAILVADEPTASLDPTTQHEILVLFKALRDDLGISIILITHSPALLVGFADRVLVLYAGRIAELGPTDAVLFSPQHPYTKALLQCLPQDGTVAVSKSRKILPAIPGAAPNLALLPQGCAFEPRCADRMEVCRMRQPASVSVAGTHTAACFKFPD